VGGIVWSPNTFCILFAIITGLAVNEFDNIVEEHGLAQPNKMINMVSAVYLFLAVFLYINRNFSCVIFMPYLFSLLYIMIGELYQQKRNPIADWAYSFAGQIYIAMPFTLLNFIANTNGDGYSYFLPLSVFVFIWLNDTGAYLFGSLLHNIIPYKLSPRISPNKTWIGSIGGGIVVVLSAVAISHLTQIANTWLWIGLGLVIAVSATFGDLTESQIKRYVGIKDSGKFLPGHGGVLDRFDSALFAIPATVIYIYCTNFIN
jgi:phosphatidate cytidylyltransferase